MNHNNHNMHKIDAFLVPVFSLHMTFLPPPYLKLTLCPSPQQSRNQNKTQQTRGPTTWPPVARPEKKHFPTYSPPQISRALASYPSTAEGTQNNRQRVRPWHTPSITEWENVFNCLWFVISRSLVTTTCHMELTLDYFKFKLSGKSAYV